MTKCYDTMDCGCYMDTSCYEIVYCPLHKAAPELLKACKEAHKAIDHLFAILAIVERGFLPSRSGQPWDAIVRLNAVMAKAEGSE